MSGRDRSIVLALLIAVGCRSGRASGTDEPRCISMPDEQWKSCGCHPRVRAAIDVIESSGLAANSRAYVERCVAHDDSGAAHRIASGLRTCLSKKVVVDAELSSTIGEIASALATRPPAPDDVCNWSRCVFGPTARCAGDERFEVCDGVDNDADGQVDEDARDARVWYRDQDGDGFGDRSQTTTSCHRPDGFVMSDSDCCDRDERAFPDQTIAYDQPNGCGGYDYDCDGRASPSGTRRAACSWPTCGVEGTGWLTTPTSCGSPGVYVDVCRAEDFDCTTATSKRRLSCR